MPWWRRRARHRPRRITGRGPGPAALAPEPTLPQPLAAIDERTPEASAAAAQNPRHGCVGVGEGEREGEGAGRGAKTEGDGGGSGGSDGSVASGASGCVVGSSGRWGDRVGGSGGGSGGSSGGSNDSDGDGKQEPHGAPQDKS